MIDNYTIPSYWKIKGGEGLDRWLEIKGKNCSITLEPRPSYCDRGNYIAKIFPTDNLILSIDGQDLWPRYYMDFDRAIKEIEDWMKKREEWVEP